jgi:hypothetical protein
LKRPPSDKRASLFLTIADDEFKKFLITPTPNHRTLKTTLSDAIVVLFVAMNVGEAECVDGDVVDNVLKSFDI